MTELTHQYLLDQLAQERAEEARKKIGQYITGKLKHPEPSGYDNGDDQNESKN